MIVAIYSKFITGGLGAAGLAAVNIVWAHVCGGGVFVVSMCI